MKKKIALIIEEKGFKEQEYSIIKEMLESDGIDTITISNQFKVVSCKENDLEDIEITLKELDTTSIDGICLIGEITNSREIRSIIEEINILKKIIASIGCSKLLATLSILKNKKFTCQQDEIEYIKKMRGIYLNENVVIDENIITAKRGYQDELILAILKLLKI